MARHYEGYWVTSQLIRTIDCLDMNILCSFDGGVEEEEVILVAELEIFRSEYIYTLRRVLYYYYPSTTRRPSHQQWEEKQPPIVAANNDHLDWEKLMWDWDTDTVIPFGKSYLCWVDYCIGVLFCNVFDENPVLLYPVKIPGLDRREGWTSVYQSIGATNKDDDNSVMKFVSVVRDDRLVTENLAAGSVDGGITWVQETVVKSDELWALDGFATLPRAPLQYPLMSLDSPSAEGKKDVGYYYDDTWVVAIDMTCKALVATFPYIKAVEQQ
uniref:DUF1618 domain-containing protein n=1 Tax=Leersia perrieri TaxID=77586 RepID=A0A0D9XZU7_9ORYZ